MVSLFADEITHDGEIFRIYKRGHLIAEYIDAKAEGAGNAAIRQAYPTFPFEQTKADNFHVYEKYYHAEFLKQQNKWLSWISTHPQFSELGNFKDIVSWDKESVMVLETALAEAEKAAETQTPESSSDSEGE